MKRSDFLKRLGVGAAAAIITPSVFINKENTEFIKDINEPVTFTPKRISAKMDISPQLLDMYSCSTTMLTPVFTIDPITNELKMTGWA